MIKRQFLLHTTIKLDMTEYSHVHEVLYYYYYDDDDDDDDDDDECIIIIINLSDC